MPGGYCSEWHRKYSCNHGTLVLTGKIRRKAWERRKKGGGTERSANDRCEDNYTMEWKQNNEMPGKPLWNKEKAWASSLHTTNTLFRGNCHFSDSVEDIGHLWQRTYQGLERRCEVRTHKSLANNLLNGAMEKNDSKIQNKGGSPLLIQLPLSCRSTQGCWRQMASQALHGLPLLRPPKREIVTPFRCFIQS